MNKVLDFIFENIKSTYVLGAISIISAIVYFAIYQHITILIIFIVSVVFFAFALGHHIYTKTKQLIQNHKKKISAIQKDYAERFQKVRDIYEFLNKEEREVYYDLFYQKEKIVPNSDFHFDNITSTFSSISENPLPGEDNIDRYYYILRCKLNEIYSNGEGANWHWGWKSYRFTMEPTYREKYKDVIEEVKRFVEENE